MDDLNLAAPLLMDARFCAAQRFQANNPTEYASLLFPTRTQPSERDLVHGCLAVVSVRGSIYHRGWRSYEWIERDFIRALENDSVKGIVFDIDSPGGVVSGCFDLSDLIYEARGKKPMIAISNEACASGAFALGSSCDELIVTRTADVGSVGVLSIHWDMSAALERWGETVTLIYEGEHKADGNPYNPLPEEVKARIQSELADTYEIFVNTVSRNRGMTAEEVRATEALCYAGEKAVEIGFADRVDSAREAIAKFAKKVKQPTQFGAFSMKIKASDLKDRLAKTGMDDEAITAAFPDVDFESEVEVDVDDDQVESPKNPGGQGVDQKARIKAIVGSESAEGRETLAHHLAFETEVSVEEAEKTLSAAPKSIGDPLSQAMNNGDQPNVEGEGDEPEETVSASWKKSFARNGAKFKD
jgi:signal peptide peptidase SppA